MSTRKKKLCIVLSLVIIAGIVFGACTLLRFLFKDDPPIEDVSTTDPGCYMQMNHYMAELLRDEYRGIFPKEIPANCLPDYLYEYSCDFDGRLYYTVYLALTYSSPDDYLSQKESVYKEILSDAVTASGEKHYIIYSLSGLDNAFSENEPYYTGYSASLIAMSDEEYTIRYLVTEQYGNEHGQAENVAQMLNGLMNEDFFPRSFF